MNRSRWLRGFQSRRVPHTRGDEPDVLADHCDVSTGVPHTRGDEPDTAQEVEVQTGVFPTPVGMNRFCKRFRGKDDRVPHTRGDEPFWPSLAGGCGQCSPHPWG